MIALYLVTGLALIISFLMDHAKSILALKKAVKRFLHILPDLLFITALVSVVLYLIPESAIGRYLGGQNIWLSSLLAAFVGSITLMPGFIAYPLCALLLEQGTPYGVIGIFSTTLMMVGVVTFPLEQRYFGIKTALLRNAISLLIALIVGICIGFLYGEFV